jgi:hypothetical protein
MPTPAQVQPYVLGIVTVVVVWRVYTRVRRLVGRQKFSPVRSWLSVSLFPVLLLTLLAGTLTHPLRSLSELTGIVIGVALGVHGLRLTLFEASEQERFYTPNAHIGIGLSLLFFGRVVYKLVHAYTSTAGFTEPPGEIVKSPLTLLIVGTLAGYYATYAFGLLRWRYRGVVPGLQKPAAPVDS